MKSKNIIYIILALIMLGGLFFFLKPKATQKTPNSPLNTRDESTQITTSPTITPEGSGIFELVIENKKIVSGPTTIQVRQGEEITLKITSDEAEELHVHAYDNSVDLEPNEVATLTFTANLSGRFPFELELSKTEIGILEVQPQ